MQIIYASTSGNVEATVEAVAEVLAANGINSTLHRAERTSADVLENNKLFLLATSTWEHGRINPYFDKLLGEMQSMDLSGKAAAFLGCGDRRYEEVLFNRGIEILHEAFTARKGARIGDVLRIDGEPYSLLDGLVADWASAIAHELHKYGH